MSTRKSFDNETSQAIGRRIKEIRGERTQAAFAELLGVDRATLANYESGRRVPNDSVLKMIATISNRTVPEILFGESSYDFNSVNDRITEHIMRKSKERPGYIPRWMFSDDEISLIVVFRLSLMASNDISNIVELLDRAQSAIDQTREATGLPAYGEGHVERLRAAIKRGFFEEGFDPDAALFATLIEERLERERKS